MNFFRSKANVLTIPVISFHTVLPRKLLRNFFCLINSFTCDVKYYGNSTEFVNILYNIHYQAYVINNDR